MESNNPLIVDTIPPILRRWQWRLGWGLLVFGLIAVGWCWLRRDDLEDLGLVVVLATLLILGSALCFAAWSYRVTWHIDSPNKTATRRRTVVGRGWEIVFTAKEFQEIRLWYRVAQKDYPSMYLAEFLLRDGETFLLLTSSYQAEEIREITKSVSEKLGLAVNDRI